MTAYETAEKLRGKGVLAMEIEECLRLGYVHVSPQYVLLGFRIGAGWFIRLAVGRDALSEFVRLMPYRLDYIGWAREGRGRSEVEWHPTDKVLKKVEQYERIRVRSQENLVLKNEGARSSMHDGRRRKPKTSQATCPA